ncbi:hypothetical protein V493_07514 [Pseudogymnoascus sp. VKM F-4281 (FW-2241)]|nr:hypothetical protein V493_07514 [Pseudogymnoascus sp. VKM F-4281 (FW-2241)]
MLIVLRLGWSRAFDLGSIATALSRASPPSPLPSPCEVRAEEGILGNRAGTVVHEVVLGEQAAECAGGELAHVGPELEDPAKLVHKCHRIAVDRIHEVGAPEFDNRRCEDRRCAGGLPRELSGEVVGPREAGARDGRLQVFGSPARDRRGASKEVVPIEHIAHVSALVGAFLGDVVGAADDDLGEGETRAGGDSEAGADEDRVADVANVTNSVLTGRKGGGAAGEDPDPLDDKEEAGGEDV